MTHPGKERLEAIREGMEGVTPGPWRSRGMGGDSFVVAASHKWNDPLGGGSGPAQYPIAIRRTIDLGDGEGNYTDYAASFMHADARHIAATNPDAMAEVLAYVDELERLANGAVGNFNNLANLAGGLFVDETTPEKEMKNFLHIEQVAASYAKGLHMSLKEPS